MGSETEGELWEWLTEGEIQALHEVQVGREWLERAHGRLLAFHHAVGHGMDHFAEAERLLREEHPGPANEIRDEVLPRGVDGDRWSYGLVESYEGTMLSAVRALEADVREDLADGTRHLHERRQRRRWRERARE